MQVSRVEPEDDAAILPVEGRVLAADRPFPHETPFVESGRVCTVDVWCVHDEPPGRHEVLGAVGKT
jgi:hypothetical protein